MRKFAEESAMTAKLQTLFHTVATPTPDLWIVVSTKPGLSSREKVNASANTVRVALLRQRVPCGLNWRNLAGLKSSMTMMIEAARTKGTGKPAWKMNTGRSKASLSAGPKRQRCLSVARVAEGMRKRRKAAYFLRGVRS